MDFRDTEQEESVKAAVAQICSAYHVERYLREVIVPRIAPISPQLVLCFIAERVLGLPKSY